MQTLPTRARLRNRLRIARREAGLSLRRLATLADVAKPTLIAIERDDGYTPNTATAMRIAGALGVPLNDLFWSESDGAA